MTNIKILSFIHPDCGPCKIMGPILRDLSKEYQQEVIFEYVNTKEEPEVAKAQGVRGVPTFMFFRGETKVAQVEGQVQYEVLKDLIGQQLHDNL